MSQEACLQGIETLPLLLIKKEEEEIKEKEGKNKSAAPRRRCLRDVRLKHVCYSKQG